jgi:hypothetical protein
MGLPSGKSLQPVLARLYETETVAGWSMAFIVTRN